MIFTLIISYHCIVSDGEGVLFNVERLDPVGDPNSSISHAAGDMLIPFTVSVDVEKDYYKCNLVLAEMLLIVCIIPSPYNYYIPTI